MFQESGFWGVILAVISLAAFLSFWRSQRKSQQVKPFDIVQAQTQKARSVGLQTIRSQFEVQYAPGGGIEIESLSGALTKLVKMNLGLRLINPSEYKVTIKDVKWSLWIGPIVKDFSSSSNIVLKAKDTIERYGIQDVLSEKDFMELVKATQGAESFGYLEGAVVCETDFGVFEKRFVGFKIPYEIRGAIGPLVEEAQSDQPQNVDSLTGFLQRKFIEEQFQNIIDTVTPHQPVSLMMVDIDHFKTFNDTHGHLVGDEILKTVCQKIKQVIGEKGLAVRYGGDEFCVILEGVDSEEADQIARALHRSVGECRLRTPQGELKITLSIGVGVLRAQSDYRELIKMADRALYESKRKGRNQVTTDHGKS